MFRLKKNQKGFTLIELLIVVAIIAILAAIAIPQFSSYRIKGYNSAADSDLRNIKLALEAFFTDNQCYCSTAGTTQPAAGSAPTQSFQGAGAAGAQVILTGPFSFTLYVTAGGVATGFPSSPAMMQFGLSNQVSATILTSASGSDYATAAANTSGDTIYAGESNVTALLRSGKDSGGASVAIASTTQVAGAVMSYKPTGATENPTSDLGANFVAM